MSVVGDEQSGKDSWDQPWQTHTQQLPCLLSPPRPQAGCPLHFTGMTLGSKVTWLICCSYSAWLCLCMSGFLLHWASGHIWCLGLFFLLASPAQEDSVFFVF